MNLEQYAAQQAQYLQEESKAHEVLDVDQVAMKLDAEKLSSLMAQLQEDIDERMAPAAILERLTGAMFGTSSQQAAAVAVIIDEDRHPGGHELAIASLQARRKLITQQQRQLEAQAKKLEEEAAHLIDQERDLTRQATEEESVDAALSEVLTFCKTREPGPGMITEMESLYIRYKENALAMGLLHGFMVDLARRGILSGEFDLLQRQFLKTLQDKIEAALK